MAAKYMFVHYGTCINIQFTCKTSDFNLSFSRFTELDISSKLPLKGRTTIALIVKLKSTKKTYCKDFQAFHPIFYLSTQLSDHSCRHKNMHWCWIIIYAYISQVGITSSQKVGFCCM